MKNQIVGNLGMYYVCYKLSKMGWNVMPTARNARGIDIVAYKDDGSEDNLGFVGIQVKTLSKRSDLPLGKNRAHLMGDYWCVVVCQKDGDPDVYVLTPEEIRAGCPKSDSKGSYWVPYKAFATDTFKNKWDRMAIKTAIATESRGILGNSAAGQTLGAIERTNAKYGRIRTK